MTAEPVNVGAAAQISRLVQIASEDGNIDGRAEAKATALLELDALATVAGLDILEIGAGNLDNCVMFKALGARRVYAADISADWDATYGEKAIDGVITTMCLDARGITERFAPESLDLVYGTAVIEHLNDVEACFGQMFAVLRPGGIAALSGGPIWTGTNGHHVWVTEGEMNYRFTGPNPIPPWFHLTHDQESLARFLVDEKGLSSAHAEAVAYCVYENGHINRYGYRRLREAAALSGFELYHIGENKTPPPPQDLLAEIEEGKWANEGPFDVLGVDFVLRKKGDDLRRSLPSGSAFKSSCDESDTASGLKSTLEERRERNRLGNVANVGAEFDSKEFEEFLRRCGVTAAASLSARLIIYVLFVGDAEREKFVQTVRDIANVFGGERLPSCVRELEFLRDYAQLAPTRKFLALSILAAATGAEAVFDDWSAAIVNRTVRNDDVHGALALRNLHHALRDTPLGRRLSPRLDSRSLATLERFIADRIEAMAHIIASYARAVGGEELTQFIEEAGNRAQSGVERSQKLKAGEDARTKEPSQPGDRGSETAASEVGSNSAEREWIVNQIEAVYGRPAELSERLTKTAFAEIESIARQVALKKPEIDFLEIGPPNGVPMAVWTSCFGRYARLGALVSLHPNALAPFRPRASRDDKEVLVANAPETADRAKLLYARCDINVEIIHEAAREALSRRLRMRPRFDAILVEGKPEGLNPLIDFSAAVALLRPASYVILAATNFPDVASIKQICEKHLTKVAETSVYACFRLP